MRHMSEKEEEIFNKELDNFLENAESIIFNENKTNHKEFLDKGFSISKGSYLIVKNGNTKRYNKNHYALKHLSMGGWNEIGTRENWEDFVEYVKVTAKEFFTESV